MFKSRAEEEGGEIVERRRDMGMVCVFILGKGRQIKRRRKKWSGSKVIMRASLENRNTERK